VGDVYDELVAAQSPAELRQAVQLYVQVRPQRVLEIGTLHGGTLRCWLEHAQPGAVVVAVDPNHLGAERYDTWVPPGVQLVVVYGRSQDDHIREQVRVHAPFDWCFIDGDHAAEAVLADAGMCLSMTGTGGHILFHDTVPPPGWGPTPPGEVWSALAQEYRSWEYAEPRPPGYPPESANGIGVVEV